MTGIAPLSATPRPQTDREKLAKVARQFEALFVKQMLAAARKADFGDDLFGGHSDGGGALDTFRQMQDDHFADVTAETGALGLAARIEAQLARFLPVETQAAK